MMHINIQRDQGFSQLVKVALIISGVISTHSYTAQK